LTKRGKPFHFISLPRVPLPLSETLEMAAANPGGGDVGGGDPFVGGPRMAGGGEHPVSSAAPAGTSVGGNSRLGLSLEQAAAAALAKVVHASPAKSSHRWASSLGGVE
jgi:hypothetical protein